MTKRDYIIIAKALASARPILKMDPCAYAALTAWEKACNSVKSALAQDNSTFDAERFMKACNE